MKRIQAKPTPRLRCAIYCRKSSEEGLRQEFNSLDAQRAACEAYVASQRSLGWICLADRYEDGGYSGGNTERPALQRLMADIAAGNVEVVVVYKIDRLSRSLADFVKLMAAFEERKVAFVSVTQAFDTSSSMGRLTLNILLSFAQFEREIIGERIRDKLAASRQRGKWTGGTPILGYDVDRSGPSPKLAVNPAEAARVVVIFELYAELGGLLSVVRELARRGWRNKQWMTRDGRARGGGEIDKTRLRELLTNRLYIGKLRHRDAWYDGEHEAIVPVDLFERVQRQLAENGRGGPAQRTRYTALLSGLLRCRACDSAMTHTFSGSGATRRRYYCCTRRMKRGADSCPTRSIPADEIERVVVDEIRAIGRDAEVVRAVVAEARAQQKAHIERLKRERRTLRRDPGSVERVTALEQQIAALDGDAITQREVAAALTEFDAVWAALQPREQARVIQLLVQRVTYDALGGAIDIAFHETGIRALAAKATDESESAA